MQSVFNGSPLDYALDQFYYMSVQSDCWLVTVEAFEYSEAMLKTQFEMILAFWHGGSRLKMGIL